MPASEAALSGSTRTTTTPRILLGRRKRRARSRSRSRTLIPAASGVSRLLHGRKGRVRARGLAAWPFPQADGDHLFPAVAHDVKTSDRAGAPPGDLAGDFVGAGHALAVDARNEVVGAQPGRRSPGEPLVGVLEDRVGPSNDPSFKVRCSPASTSVSSQIAARHATVRLQLWEDGARFVDGHCEADIGGTLADGGADADDVAAAVDQRSAAVSEKLMAASVWM